MAIYTPRGVRIRIPTDYAFGLIGRLHPRVTAYQVLKTTEALHAIPSMFHYAVALILLAFGLSWPPTIMLAIVAAHLLGTFLNLLGLCNVPALVVAATIFSYLTGYGALFLLIAGLAFLRGGPEWMGGYVGGMILSFPAGFIVERLYRRAGHTDPTLGRAEINFFNAYRYHAAALEDDTSITLRPEEFEEDAWREVYDEFASAWPDVAARFTEEKE